MLLLVVVGLVVAVLVNTLRLPNHQLAAVPAALAVALVGISEKGYLSLVPLAAGHGGHSFMPPRTSVGRVAAAVARLKAEPFPARLDGSIGSTLTYRTPAMPFG